VEILVFPVRKTNNSDNRTKRVRPTNHFFTFRFSFTFPHRIIPKIKKIGAVINRDIFVRMDKRKLTQKKPMASSLFFDFESDPKIKWK
jgi:hypothetical protein